MKKKKSGVKQRVKQEKGVPVSWFIIGIIIAIILSFLISMLIVKQLGGVKEVTADGSGEIIVDVNGVEKNTGKIVVDVRSSDDKEVNSNAS